MSIKKDIVVGVRVFWSFLACIALLIGGRIVQLQMGDVSELGEKAVQIKIEDEVIEAPRGEIYAKNGYLLACSLTYFELRMDLGAPSIIDSVFNADVDSLALCLSQLFQDKSKVAYLKELKKARRKPERYYHLGNRKVNYMEAEKIKQFPIFRRGKYRGGLILVDEILRHRPFGTMAKRTLGRLEKNAKGRRVGQLGLEDAYESELKGADGVMGVRYAARKHMDFIKRESEEGNDVITTLDVDIQDVAETALREQLEHFKAHHGTAVVMEVQTGELKAIANLEVSPENGKYYERRNHAIADAVEPGSIFKLPSMIALLEDGKIRLTDSVKTGNGRKRFYGATMTDYHACGTITVQQVFEKSSNVGVSMLVHSAYKDNPQKYIDRLYDFHLGEPLQMKVKGEGRPYIKDTKSKAWWGTTLPWMSIGYELNVTPLQMLTFYNAIANNGKMVKPRLVYAIERNGKMVRDFSEPIIIDNNICSEETLKKAKIMLEGVVERGTARNIKDERYKIAGKTGTAHIAKSGGGYDNKNYRATFVGYFPADNPQYSCIVVVEKPDRSIGRFGGSVAGPVFKKIADALYAEGRLAEAKPLQSVVDSVSRKITLLSGINKDVSLKQSLGEEYVKSKKVVKAEKGLMPDVVGMSLVDALFLLESKGLRVHIEGSGVIRKQSVVAGKGVKKSTEVNLVLS